MVRLRLSQDDILFFLSGPERSWKIARQPEPLSREGKELALAYFNHVETQVGLAATTAYLTLVADTILVSAYVTLFKDSELSRLLVGTAGGFLCVATLCALVTVIPHMKKKSGTVFYFRTVAAMPDGDYLRDFTLHDRNATLHVELLKQVQGKCRHLRWMFWMVRAAIFFTFLGTLLMVYAFASKHNPVKPGDCQSTSQKSTVRLAPRHSQPTMCSSGTISNSGIDTAS